MSMIILPFVPLHTYLALLGCHPSVSLPLHEPNPLMLNSDNAWLRGGLQNLQPLEGKRGNCNSRGTSLLMWSLE